MGWNAAPGVVGSPVVKKLIRIDIPADKYPNVCTTYFYLKLLG
jgi:protein quaking